MGTRYTIATVEAKEDFHRLLIDYLMEEQADIAKLDSSRKGWMENK